jgi:hypothetical protein
VVKFGMCLALFPPRSYVKPSYVQGGLRGLLAGRGDPHRMLFPPLERPTLLGVLLNFFQEIDSSIFFAQDYKRVGVHWVGLCGWVLFSCEVEH